MNILFAADVPPEPNSGASGTEYQTVKAIRRLGHNVLTIWQDDLHNRIKHGNLHYLLELPVRYRNSINNMCKAHKFDVIHVNQPYSWLAAMANQFSTRHSIFINRSHGWEPNVLENLTIWRKLYKVKEWNGLSAFPGVILKYINSRLYPILCAKYSDGIIVSSKNDKNFICENYDFDKKRVSVIHQAIPNSFYDTFPKSFSKYRLKKILYVGQFAFIKAPQLLGRIISNVMATHNDTCFTWCCHKKYHQEALALIDNTVYDRITMVDWQDQRNLITLYDTHGIFLFPSFYEGFGKAPLEAMSRGMCVISSDTGGMKDIIINGINGFLIEIGDTFTFIKKTLNLLDDYEFARTISSEAMNTVSGYSWLKVAKNTISFYEQIKSICDR